MATQLSTSHRFAAALFTVLALCFALTLNSCGDKDEDEKLPEVSGDANSIVKQRAEKDRYFKYDTTSPLPREMRKSFTGLSYYPYDEQYVVIASFEASESQEVIQMPASQREMRKMLCVGQFSFSLGTDDKVYKLSGYRQVDNPHSPIVIPFKDKTTGHGSYEAGRYIDIEDVGDEVTLDFNTAYNPYCAFNDSYSCLLIPPQNVLNVAINAGEKSFHAPTKDAKK